MKLYNSDTVLGAVLLFGVVNVVAGWYVPDVWLTSSGMIGLCYVLLRVALNDRLAKSAPKPQSPQPSQLSRPSRPVPSKVPSARKPVDPGDTDSLVERMLEQGRFALLLRPQVVKNLSRLQFGRAREALEETMALVPDGEVVLGQLDEELDDGRLDEEEITAAKARVVQVERLFMDRYPVTNEQYYEFVAAGGYGETALWDESILPAVLDMVDSTGLPGPRYWKDGCYAPGEDDLPVVGICWHEAVAYARWLGKRLPTDAEWVKAGSWPVPLDDNSRMQRKFPWGNTMDRTRANLWGSGPERIVSVDDFESGVSVGGIFQLVGNVWEWTCGDFANGTFRTGNHSVGELVLSAPMKSIRGGAFDTYFDNHASCQFHSGDNPLSRKYNIGFRCAVAVRDLALTRSEKKRGVAARASAPAQTPGPIAEEDKPKTEQAPVVEQAPAAEEMPV